MHHGRAADRGSGERFCAGMSISGFEAAKRRLLLLANAHSFRQRITATIDSPKDFRCVESEVRTNRGRGGWPEPVLNQFGNLSDRLSVWQCLKSFKDRVTNGTW